MERNVSAFQPDSKTLEAFGIFTKPVPLPGGEGRTFRAGNMVLKHISQDARDYTEWISKLYSQIKENGFRVPKPILTKNKERITPRGWTAWTYISGNHNFRKQVPQSIKAIRAFHRELKQVSQPSFLTNDTPYTRADHYAWATAPKKVRRAVKREVDRLYALRTPLDKVKNQLIHGDLNPDNILFSPTHPPAIIDLAPYWRPVDFALAVYAYWIGPWRNNTHMLNFFRDVPNFTQLLIRAALRMLLIMSEFNRINDLAKHQLAVQIICKQAFEEK